MSAAHLDDLKKIFLKRLPFFELAEHLRATRPGLRVLFMSGYADDAVVRRGVQAGVMPLLNKPFMPEALARKVREVLNQPPPTGPLRIPVTPVAGIPPRR